jgi:hypothetical protein
MSENCRYFVAKRKQYFEIARDSLEQRFQTRLFPVHIRPVEQRIAMQVEIGTQSEQLPHPSRNVLVTHS